MATHIVYLTVRFRQTKQRYVFSRAVGLSSFGGSALHTSSLWLGRRGVGVVTGACRRFPPETRSGFSPQAGFAKHRLALPLGGICVEFGWDRLCKIDVKACADFFWFFCFPTWPSLLSVRPSSNRTQGPGLWLRTKTVSCLCEESYYVTRWGLSPSVSSLTEARLR